MRSIIIFVHIMVISTLLKAQSSKLDSMLSRMTTETEDSLVCALTGNAGYYLATRNYDSSMLLLNRAMPRVKPSIVERTMPMKATSSVLVMPTSSASQ